MNADPRTGPAGAGVRRGRPNRDSVVVVLSLLLSLAAGCDLGASGSVDIWEWHGRPDAAGWDVPPEVNEWPDRAAAIQEEVRVVLEPFAPSAPEPLVVAEEVVAGDLLRQQLEFTTFDGERATAVLMRPNDELVRPGLLLLHGHDVDAERMTTENDSYVRGLGLTLARAGFVTLSPDVRSFGSFRPFGMGHWRSDGYVAWVRGQGDVYLRLAVNDARVALRMLRETPGVDPGRIGMAGISLGCLITLVTAAAEGDVDAVVLSGLYLPFDELFAPKGHHECQRLHPLADVTTADELAATLLRGHVQVHWGSTDPFYEQDHGDDLFVALAERAVELCCDGRVELHVTEDAGHAFDPPVHAAFFERALGLPRATPGVLPPIDPRTVGAFP